MYYSLLHLILFVSHREIPTELRHAAKGGEVNVEIEDHRTESFTTPKKKVAAFTGEGHKLGKSVELNSTHAH